MSRWIVPLAVFVCAFASLTAQDADPYAKEIAPASDEAVKAMRRFRLAEGMKAEVFAAEPLLVNPIAFCFDEKGRAYVAETFRLHRGVTDNRGHPPLWTDDDLAARTVADRVALYKKHLGRKFADYGKHDDRVRLVWDSDGDGRADKASVFAGGFKRPEDGLGSGVLARGGKVWFTNIPDLWLLEDTNGTGRADVKKSLHTGYGVHIAFIGHDLHGLAMGPDGKLYFSVGDRGLHVVTNGRTLSTPDSGAVLRCNPDGSELEIFATGLRNPQELAFDELGNLFTGDNNADGGDQARWVHLVDGGDSGWRIGYQYLPGLGPWNSEQMWTPRHDTQPAFLVPPLVNMASGPSGLCYHPGVALVPEKYQRHFFLCDFRGGPGNSGISTFSLKAKGASFEVVGQEEFIWSVLATDCDFGPDGGFYVSDWVDGWGLTGKGRLYKFLDPARLSDPRVAEVQRLLAEGLSKQPAADVAKLLEHPDMRVRQEAQLELARRKDVATLAGATRGSHQLARLHAIWGLGQIGRSDAGAHSEIVRLAADADAEVRAQAIKVLGEDRVKSGLAAITAGLKDVQPRVRLFSALAMAKVGTVASMPAVLDMLRANADQDVYLRHAGVMALAGIGDKAELQKAAFDSSPAARMGVVLAMRRLHMPEIAHFLGDAEPRLVAEAARAIYDEPIRAALPQLAGLASRAGNISQSMPAAFAEPVVRRIAAAHRALGRPESAGALAALAANDHVAAKVRLEALTHLRTWEKPSGRDPIVGLWRPVPARPGAEVAAALQSKLGELMTGPDNLRTEAVRLAGKHGIGAVGPFLRTLVFDKERPASVRVESLKALAALEDAELEPIAKRAAESEEPRLRFEATRLLFANAKPEEAAARFAVLLDDGTTYEQQESFKVLADLKAAPADAVLGRWLDRLLANEVRAEVQLDLMEAVQRRGTSELKQKLAAYEAARPKADPLAAWRPALAGGDAERGRELFFDKTELSCLRCHKALGTGGDVGPDLTGIGKNQKRDYLLEAIVDPNRHIAKGFDTVVLSLANGQFKSGILKSDDGKEVRLMTPEGQTLTIRAADIEERSKGKSAMPDDLIEKMTRSELRDLVEFLAGL